MSRTHFNHHIIRMAMLIGFAALFAAGPSWAAPNETFHGNNQRTGLSPYAGPDKPEIKWTFYADSSFYASPLVGADGQIYIGSTDNFLYALEPDGSLNWTFEAQDSIFSTPALAYESDIIVADHSGTVYSVNADGMENWRYAIGSPYESRMIAPVLVTEEGECFIGSWNENLYSIKPDGALRMSLDNGGKISSGVAEDKDGYIYVCTNSGAKLTIKKYQSGSRRELQSFNSEQLQAGQNRIISTPAIDSDRNVLYVGASRRSDGMLYALNLSTFQRYFRISLPKAVYGSPAIGPDGTVYTGCLDGKLYAVDPDSKTIKWSFSIRPDGLDDDPDYNGPPYVMSSPVVDKNGVVYFGDTSGNFYAVGPDGAERWRMELALSNIVAAPVITADGLLLVASYDSTLYAIGEATPVKNWETY
ncbi:MAG: PQQ-binding-like beta-propeller repeat protein [bacterium]|nr:PQQ-binding-like beta-propeller repeat protein [bacterium]